MGKNMSAPLTPPSERPPPPSYSPLRPNLKSRSSLRTQSVMIKAKYSRDFKDIQAQPHVAASEVHIRKHVSQAKNSECEQVAVAFESAVKTIGIDAELPPPPNNAQKKEYLKNQVIVCLERQHKRDPSFDLESAQSAVSNAIEDQAFSYIDIKKILHDHAVGHIEGAEEIIMRDLKPALDAFAATDKVFKNEYGNLLSILQKIEQLATNKLENASYADQNKEVLFLMRQALQNPAYHLLKHDETHAAIKMIHGLCLASYAQPKVLEAFAPLGQSLQNLVPADVKNKGLDEQLKASRDAGYKKGLIKNDKSRQYIAKYFKQVVGAFFSTKFGTKVAAFFGKAYDPRGELGNNAGALYTEKMQVGQKEVKLRTVYTPSPTIGDSVSPEARGILQAMENRSFMDAEMLEAAPYPFVVWNYTNLQSLSSPDEGARAANIMRLNDEFPFSFQGISITVDSPFYRAGVHGSDEAKIQAAIADKTKLNEAYKQEQLAELTHESNFTLEARRQNPGGGYYFPAKTDQEKQKWCKAFEDIVDRAFITVALQKKPQGMEEAKWHWYQKAAFRELVLMGVVKYSQVQTAEHVAERATGGKVMVTNACKENIDRGGKTNACFLWALGGSKDDVFAAFHARALLGRFRLVLPDRVEPMYALTMVLPQEEVAIFLNGDDRPIELGSEIAEGEGEL